ncbi:MAG: transposase [Albidovulum sp.]|nr:transposase [Albidovulum sp.]
MGTASLFPAFAPSERWRCVEVAGGRIAFGWTRFVRDLADTHFPGIKIVLAMDGLKTHGTASLYEAFDPGEASRLRKRIEFCSPPKRGSRLNMAEIEISAMSRQCFNRRILDREIMCREVAADAKPAKKREDSKLELQNERRSHKAQVPLSVIPKKLEY